jgi:hypothetical protein
VHGCFDQGARFVLQWSEDGGAKDQVSLSDPDPLGQASEASAAVINVYGL